MKKIKIAAVGLMVAMASAGCSELKNSVAAGEIYMVEDCAPVYDRMLERWRWSCELVSVQDHRNAPTIIIDEELSGEVSFELVRNTKE